MRNFRDIISEIIPEGITSGEVIKFSRNRLNLTQKEVCKITGLKRENLSAIENGKIQMTAYYAEIFSAVFGLHPSTILFPNGEFIKTKQLKAIERKAQQLVNKKLKKSA